MGVRGRGALEAGMRLTQEAMQKSKLRRNIGSRGTVTGPAGDVYAVERLVQKFP